MKSSGWDTPRGVSLDAIFCWFVAVGGGVEECRGGGRSCRGGRAKGGRTITAADGICL